jgi:hypothetical protein
MSMLEVLDGVLEKPENFTVWFKILLQEMTV